MIVCSHDYSVGIYTVYVPTRAEGQKSKMSSSIDLSPVINVIIAIVPLIVVLAVLKMLVDMFKGFSA